MQKRGPRDAEELAQAMFRAAERKTQVSVRTRVLVTAVCIVFVGLMSWRVVIPAGTGGLSEFARYYWDYLLIMLGVCVASSVWCYILARRHEWDWWLWGMCGFLFAPLSIAIALAKASERKV